MIAAGAAFALVAAVSISHLHKEQAAPPYQPSALAAKVSLEALPGPQAAARAEQLAGRPVGVLNAPVVIVGQLRFTTPGNAPHIGQYSLFVIDNASDKPVSVLAGAGLKGSVIRPGWDRRYDTVVAKFGHSDSPTALSFAPDTAAPITFETAATSLTDPARQLTLVLAFFSSDGRLYWQTTLPS